MSQTAAQRNLSYIILRRYAIILGLSWTCVLAVLFAWQLNERRNNTFELARIQASISFEKDLVYRRWASLHGGVYVPITEETPPNPYLTDIENRDITTTSGENLTLLNPAYMTRQVQELGWEQYGLMGHITSLKPLRPENAADTWETGALQAFEQGEMEASSLEMIGEAEYLRLMWPMVAEESCLKCHAIQGYEVGDVRGGISVSVPMLPLRDIQRKENISGISGYCFLWLLGIAGIAAVSLKYTRRVHEIQEAEKRELALEARLHQNQKLASIGTLAAGVAHEINNPINGIMNYAQLIRDKSESGSSQNEYASQIILESERVARITGNLLTFSRKESQSRSLARMADIVEVGVSFVRSSLLVERITLKVDVPGDLPKVSCGSRQIQQVIMNLVMNAHDALNEQDGDLDGDRTIRVRVGLLKRENRMWMRTTVEDNGCGIPPELKKRIFDPFFTTKDRAMRSGLGLSISQTIAQNHNGDLSVETEAGEYTRFHLDLPVDNLETPGGEEEENA